MSDSEIPKWREELLKLAQEAEELARRKSKPVGDRNEIDKASSSKNE